MEFLPPEHARFPPSRREWMRRGAILGATVAAALVPVTGWVGVWGGYGHQLRVAVCHGDCVGTSVNHSG